MSEGYGTILRFQGNGTWSTANEKKSGSADLSRTMRSKASEVIGRVSRGMGFLFPNGNKRCSGSIRWASASNTKQRVKLRPYDLASRQSAGSSLLPPQHSEPSHSHVSMDLSQSS